MNRTTLTIGIIVLIIAAASAFMLIQHMEAPTPSAQTTGNASVGANGESSIVTYSDTGFAPASLTIAAGTTVTWDNQSAGKLWVKASGADDAVCTDVTMLNECQSVTRDGTYSYTFTTPGTFSYVNREKNADTGTVTVTGDAIQAGAINPDAIPQ